MSQLQTTRERLSTGRKTVYALGDHTVNLVLSAATLLYLPFLMTHGGLSPALAGLAIWIARIVDAVTDPAMGRLSDATRWRSGRRRPYFLIGALPFGCFFALMWLSVPFESELLRFAYYATVYVCVSLAMTCVSVPYLALLPEMATGYDERTSFNAFRAAAAVMGTLVAVSMKPIADSLGGGPEAWWRTALMLSVWIVLPWFAVHAVSFERPGYAKATSAGFLEGVRALGRHRSFRILAGSFVLARIAVDLIGGMFLLYFTYVIGRPEDFAPCLGLFLAIVILVLPAWLAVAKKRDKRSIFIFGAAWWSASQILIFLGDPDWPRWVMFAAPAVVALGYAVADLMPWAMLGDVIDEDELATGQRREGMYVGCFMFLRKIGGATAVLGVGLALQFAGFVGDADSSEQPEVALQTIRTLTSLVPMALLLCAVAVATRYPLTRVVHEKILEGLAQRRESLRAER